MHNSALDMVKLSFFNSLSLINKEFSREVDPRFEFVDAWVPALGIIEAVWEPEGAVEGEEREGCG